jgi:hypothetical protein
VRGSYAAAGAAAAGPKIRACMADADGVLTLLEGDLLEEVRAGR